MRKPNRKVGRPRKSVTTKIDSALRATDPSAGSRGVSSNGLNTELRKMLDSIMKNEGLSTRQKNRRAKQVLNTLRDVTSQKARTIRAVGVAAAENLTPIAGSIATTKITTDAIGNANKLIDGGANLSKNNTTDKRRDEDSTSYGDER